MKYVRREIEDVALRYLSGFSVLGLTGPRQSGKSTMLKHLLGDKYQYVTFDDYRMVALFESDPERFMEIYSDKVIFDEVQKVPAIFNYIKIAVDNDRDNCGKFVLTGSSQFVLLSRITESLAGRIGLLSLLPFSFREIPDRLRTKAEFSGSYPELVNKKFEFTQEWYSSYLESYLNKDVRAISNIGNMADFRRFLGLCAAHASEIVNMSKFAGELGVAISTIKHWLAVLQASYIIFLLDPYYNNLKKRITKSPKLYFYDTGLVSFLTGIRTEELYRDSVMAGSLFENYIISEIKKKHLNFNIRKDLYYLRTSNGLEIDLIIDDHQIAEFFEIKSTSTFKPQMLKPMQTMKKEQSTGTLLYRGKAMEYGADLRVANYKIFLSDTAQISHTM